MWLSGINKGACLVFWNPIKTIINTFNTELHKKTLLCTIFLLFKKRLSNVIHKELNHDAVMENVSRCLFLRCWGLSLRENESCPFHNSSCLAASLSLSSSTFSLSSLGVITPSLFRSWLLNMSSITCSMIIPGFMRPFPSATCSLMNSPNWN